MFHNLNKLIPNCLLVIFLVILTVKQINYDRAVSKRFIHLIYKSFDNANFRFSTLQLKTEWLTLKRGIINGGTLSE